MSRSQTNRWLKMFLSGREMVGDEPRSGHPSTSRRDLVRDSHNSKRSRLTCVRLLSEPLETVKTTASQIFGGRNAQKVCAIFVTQVLSDGSKGHRVTVCQELKELSSILLRVCTLCC